jgi:hypothetical protein
MPLARVMIVAGAAVLLCHRPLRAHDREGPAPHPGGVVAPSPAAGHVSRCAPMAPSRILVHLALDKRGRSRLTYRLVGLPTTVFIDSAGIIQRVHTGQISREDLDRGVATILPLR